MKKSNRHIIQRVNLEINTYSESKAYDIKDNVDHFMIENLLPKIEKLFDSQSVDNEIKRFESVDISIDMHPTESFEDMSDRVIRHLHEKIEELDQTDSQITNIVNQFIAPKKQNGSVQQYDLNNPERSQVDSPKSNRTDRQKEFLYFLEWGQLPWFGYPELFTEYISSGEFISELNETYFLEKIIQLLRSDENILKRFINQLENETIVQFIQHLGKEVNFRSKKLQLKIPTQNQALKELIFEQLISKLINPDYQIPQEKFRQLHHELTSKSLSKKLAGHILKILDMLDLDTSGFARFEALSNSKTPSPATFENKRTTLRPEISNSDLLTDPTLSDFVEKHNAAPETLYIQNAGLILLHPFFWNFLTQTRSTDGKNSLLPGEISRAMHLLHYLATGNEEEFEFNLTFEKFLCGIPLQTPVTRKIKLSLADKLECDELLKSVVEHWAVLKNTSPDGLRQAFLQRDGKLDLQKFPYKLFVERKAQDVLLDHLPWNISIVKLPWIKELLYVEW